MTSACIDVQRVTGAANRLPKPINSIFNAACEIACVLPGNLAQLAHVGDENEHDENGER